MASRGRLTRDAWLRQQPYWRDVLVLCSAATPEEHLGRLRRCQIGHVILGGNRVDLGAALGMLASHHRIAAVRVDAGRGLNGALLRAGLIDEISVVIAPYLAARAASRPLWLIVGLRTRPGGQHHWVLPA